jgi:hypothetical protein
MIKIPAVTSCRDRGGGPCTLHLVYCHEDGKGRLKARHSRVGHPPNSYFTAEAFYLSSSKLLYSESHNLLEPKSTCRLGCAFRLPCSQKCLQGQGPTLGRFPVGRAVGKKRAHVLNEAHPVVLSTDWELKVLVTSSSPVSSEFKGRQNTYSALHV